MLFETNIYLGRPRVAPNLFGSARLWSACLKRVLDNLGQLMHILTLFILILADGRIDPSFKLLGISIY